LPFTQYLFENVFEIPEFSNSATQSILNSKNDIPSLFHYAYQLLGSSGGGFGPPLSGAGQGKTVINQNDLDKFFEIPGVEIIQKQEWEKLPFSFRKGIVETLYSFDEVKMIFEQFSKPVKEYLNKKSAFSISEMYYELIIPWNERELKKFTSIDLIQDADLKKLSFATRKFTEKLNWFFMQKELQIPDDFANCSITSCMGELLISGTKNDTIRGGQFFVIELGGDDKYSCQSNSQAFGGTLGVGIFYDNRGNDHYNTDNIAGTENNFS